MVARTMTRNTMAMFATAMLAVAVACLLGLCFHAEKAYAVSDGWKQVNQVEIKVTDGELVIRPLDNGSSAELWSYNLRNAYDDTFNPGTVKSVRFEGAVTLKYGGNMFENFTLLETVDLTGLDFSECEDTRQMFKGCRSLREFDFTDIDLSKCHYMEEMFMGCASLKSIDLSGKTFIDSADCIRMFYGCTSLESADLSNLSVKYFNFKSMFCGCTSLKTVNFEGLTSRESYSNELRGMFDGCTSLETLNFKNIDIKASFYAQQICAGNRSLKSVDFSGSKFSSYTYFDSSFAGCASLETADFSNCNFNEGTYHGYQYWSGMFKGSASLRKVDFSNCVFYDANIKDMFMGCTALQSADFGGSTLQSYGYFDNMFYGCSSLVTADMRFDASGAWSQQQNGYAFEGNSLFYGCTSLESADLTGMAFKPGENKSMFTGCTKLSRVTLDPGFSFLYEHTVSGEDVVDVVCQLHDPPSEGAYTGKWVREDETYGPYTAAELTQKGSEEIGGTWVWDEVPRRYKLSFDGGIGAGSMAVAKPIAAEEYQIPDSGFFYPGKKVASWDDGNGHVFEAGGTIPADTYAIGDEVTLTAVWEDLNQVKKIGKGTYEIELQPGMQAKLPDVPAGTPYRVYEQTEDGWVLVQQSNTTGTIQPLQTSTASFTNQYAPEVTSAVLYGMKTLDNRAADAGSYSFELWEGDELLQTKPVVEGGAIVFDPIVYDAQGQHVYTVKEVIGNDETLTYDTHEETVTVLVQDVDAHLTARVEYDSDGIKFNNRHNPGNLVLTKDVVGQTSANADDEFTFKVTLRNPNGEPVSEGVYLHYSE